MTEQTTDTVKDAEPVETTESTEATVIDDTIITTGSLRKALRRCREQADMNLEQAAQEMRLPLNVLKALEDESFSDLPEPPYVRGYLRSYSRLNDSDPNDLIKRYEILRGADPDEITSFKPAMPLNRNQNKPSVSSSTVKLAGLVFFVFFLGILSMIPAVSQWATETWQSFSDQTTESRDEHQKLVEATQSTTQNSVDADNSLSSGTINRGGDNHEAAVINDVAASENDTPATDANEQLALNTQESSPAAESAESTDSENGASESPADADNAQSSSTESDTEKTSSDTEQADTSTNGENTASTAEQTSNATDTTASQNDTESTENSTANTEKPANAVTAEKNNSDSQQNAAKTSEEETANTPETETTQTATEDKTTTDTASREAAQSDNQQSSSNENFTQPHDGNVNIRLEFVGECWMSIKDGKGKTIYSALSAAGTVKDLKARTPLKFKVGNASGVRIYFNGQLVDQSPYIRGNVSRFEVQ